MNNVKRLVIDACVAKSAGAKKRDVCSQSCRKALDEVLKSKMIVIFCEKLLKEWTGRHSKYSRMWLVNMRAHGRAKKIVIIRRKEYREIIKLNTTEGVQRILLKDFHIVETALDSDRSVLSRDYKARKHLHEITKLIGDIANIHWVSPLENGCIEWIGAGIPLKKKYQLSSKLR